MFNRYLKGLRALFFTLLFFPTILLSNTQNDIDKIDRLKLWDTKEWKRLLHVQRSIFFYQRSEADTKAFFMHPNGKYNFKEELHALARSVLNPGNINDSHPVCKFPARTRWLYEAMGKKFNKNILNKCSEYKKYLKLVPAQSISLVFSSYYLESPASAFGHTLIRLGRPKTKHYQDTSLLDMGINSAAEVTTNNALMYSILGMFGGFKGLYSAIPYFYKVREYNDFESRDLWSYQLNFNTRQIERMINHLWEVGNASFDYYYFSENCSYNLFTLLEVADFDLELVSRLPFLFTVPSHTIQIINDIPGLVKSIHGTPSLRKKFSCYFKKLNKNHQKTLLEAYNKRDHNIILNSGINEEDITKILDTLIYFVDYKHPRDILMQEGKISIWKNQILVTRSKFNKEGFVKIPKLPKRDAPHLGHRPRRINLAASYFDNETTYHFGYRLALHSFMDPNIGQPELASLEFGDMALLYRNGRLKIDKFEFFDIMTLNPWNQFSNPFSYKIKVGMRNESILCNNCTPYNLDVGGGATFFHDGQTTIYSFLNMELLYNKKLDKDFTVKVSPEFGFKHFWFKAWVSKFSIRYDFPICSTDSYLNGEVENHFYIGNTFALFANVNYFQDHDLLVKSGLNFYF